jgi:NAD(P)-dependent dehydrogenase (short-subunit alcohol dehydrogenase family)
MRTQDLFDLSGKTALVTGGGRGIGRDLATGLAEQGADVIVASRKLENCEAAAKELEALGVRAYALAVNMLEEDSINALAETLDERGLAVDILVNNAGITWGAPMLEHPLEAWDKVYNVNVRGLFQLTQLIARRMKARGEGGVIVNVTSIGGYRGASDNVQPAIAYNSSKGAIITLTKDMAVKLAPLGIRVNAIAPGPFLTDMMGFLRGNDEILKKFTGGIPLQRTGETDDLKGVIAFLASEASAYVTGHTLPVDGGLLA